MWPRNFCNADRLELFIRVARIIHFSLAKATTPQVAGQNLATCTAYKSSRSRHCRTLPRKRGLPGKNGGTAPRILCVSRFELREVRSRPSIGSAYGQRKATSEMSFGMRRSHLTRQMRRCPPVCRISRATCDGQSESRTRSIDSSVRGTKRRFKRQTLNPEVKKSISVSRR
jgi:hypothetical protein